LTGRIQRADESPLRTEASNTARLRELAHYPRRASSVTLWKASDAADAMEKMLDTLVKVATLGHIAVQGTPIPSTRQYPHFIKGRYLCDLGVEEIDRLRLLNRKLADAEACIWRRSDESLRDYFKAGGVKDQRYSGELWEYMEKRSR
jgi:hypothetical protein